MGLVGRGRRAPLRYRTGEWLRLLSSWSTARSSGALSTPSLTARSRASWASSGITRMAQVRERPT